MVCEGWWRWNRDKVHRLPIFCTSRQGQLYTSLFSWSSTQSQHILTANNLHRYHPHYFVLLVLVLLLLLKLQKKGRKTPNIYSSSYSSPLPLGSGLSPGLTHISTANSPGLNFDGKFVSFSPSSFYGVGDSILDPVTGRRETAESAKHFRIKQFKASKFLVSSQRTKLQQKADGSWNLSSFEVREASDDCFTF